MMKKIGEVFTITREVSAGTGYSFYLTKLSDGLALIDFSQTPASGSMAGGTTVQSFTFICLKGGKATYQLAKFRVFDTSDVLYENEITVDIESDLDAANNMPGGWTSYHKPSAEEIKIFEEAFEGFVGVKFTPFLVKSQIVNGVNYSYITNAAGVYPGAIPYKAVVSIYKPINGKAVITNIVKIDEEAVKAMM